MPRLTAPALRPTLPAAHCQPRGLTTRRSTADLVVALLAAAAVAGTVPATAQTQAPTAKPARTAAPVASPDSPPSAKALEQQYRRGDTAGAQQRLAQALAAAPQDAGLRFLQGVLFSESGRSADAAQVFERMTQDFPELPEPHNNLAVIKAAQGELDAARALLEAALRMAPDYRTARQNLGDVHVRLALRAYGLAASGNAADAALQRKLALARELSALR